MRWVSTRPPHHEVTLRTAVLEDPSPDGGLYLPVSLPRLGESEIHELSRASFPNLAESLAVRLLGSSVDPDALREIVHSAFDFPVPLVRVRPSTWILELFHGPTGSFKDFGARFLARLLAVLRREDEGPVIILVATSGDTGGAVAHAVRGLKGVRAVVLFPRDRLSSVQLRQIQEPAGWRSPEEGVIPVEVDGTFDDCQRMVKEVLTEPGAGIRCSLTSANSVNIGRLLPQSFYYAHGWCSLPRAARDRPVVSVPSGNLGNLTAGVLARRLGFPLGHFLAASNANAAMGRFLEEGTLPSGPSLETLSSAMDVARPSNLERLIAMFDGDTAALGEWISPTRHEDDQVIEVMDRVYRETGYLLDPHTAVGHLGLEAYRSGSPERTELPGMVVATADPAKFPETVLKATGRNPPERMDWEEEAPRAPDGRPAAEVGAELTVRLGSETEDLRGLLRRI